MSTPLHHTPPHSTPLDSHAISIPEVRIHHYIHYTHQSTKNVLLLSWDRATKNIPYTHLSIASQYLTKAPLLLFISQKVIAKEIWVVLKEKEKNKRRVKKWTSVRWKQWVLDTRLSWWKKKREKEEKKEKERIHPKFSQKFPNPKERRFLKGAKVSFPLTSSILFYSILSLPFYSTILSFSPHTCITWSSVTRNFGSIAWIYNICLVSRVSFLPPMSSRYKP